MLDGQENYHQDERQDKAVLDGSGCFAAVRLLERVERFPRGRSLTVRIAFTGLAWINAWLASSAQGCG